MFVFSFLFATILVNKDVYIIIIIIIIIMVYPRMVTHPNINRARRRVT